MKLPDYDNDYDKNKDKNYDSDNDGYLVLFVKQLWV